MGRVGKLFSIIRTTQNFWDALQLRSFPGTKTIRFRNGVTVETDYPHYDALRYWFEQLHKSRLTLRKADEYWIIESANADSKIDFKTKYIFTAKPFFEFLYAALPRQGWSIQRTGEQYTVEKGSSKGVIEQEEENLFHLKCGGIELYGPEQVLEVYFNELSEAGAYDYDFRGKTVLDVGGFCGETAVYFSSQGAKKVIVYEPIVEHHGIIQKNLQLNHVNAEVHDSGVGETDGVASFTYDTFTTGVGVTNKIGQNKVSVKIRSISEVIKESHADIAKIDCEGAEISLTTVAPDVLGLIAYYIVETHSEDIANAVSAKFLSSGFRVAREPVPLAKGIAVLYFEKTKA